MSGPLVPLGKRAGSAAIKYLSARLDPNKSRALDEEITAYVLAELPRLKQLIDERFAQIEASSLTHEETLIIIHQTFDSMQRTLDQEKRRRLTNVLVNGLCASLDKVKLRLLIRLTAEIEEEHIEVLRLEARTPDERLRDLQARPPGPTIIPTPREVYEEQAIGRALDRELVARGLLSENIKPKVKTQAFQSTGDRLAVEKVELETRITISKLGRDLLAFLRDPPPAADAAGVPVQPAAPPTTA